MIIMLDTAPEIDHNPPILEGKRVAILFPAWHNCGTYRVILGQLSAYKNMGAEICPIAVSTDPGFSPSRKWIWRSFIKATPELDNYKRFCAGATLSSVLRFRTLTDITWPYWHGDQAVIRTGIISLAELPEELKNTKFDLVHCNHFFVMPLARSIKSEATKIFLDTHDVQARQFMLLNQSSFCLYPKTTYTQLLTQEIDQMKAADLLIHLNSQEHIDFNSLLPTSNHALLYPAVPDVGCAGDGEDIIIVSANNSANVESMIWFLTRIASKLIGLPIKIIGNIVDGIKSRSPHLYKMYKHWFCGPVNDLGRVYGDAKLILLPTISGHGLSIKTIEALASGLPIIATSHALRGIDDDVQSVEQLLILDDPDAFAAAVLKFSKRSNTGVSLIRGTSSSRQFYNDHFSQETYNKNLQELVARHLS